MTQDLTRDETSLVFLNVGILAPTRRKKGSRSWNANDASRVYTLLKYLLDDSVTVLNVKKPVIKNSGPGRNKKLAPFAQYLKLAKLLFACFTK